MSRTFAAVLVCCSWVMLPVARAAEDDKVNVTVVVILAGEEGDKVDPQLKAIAAEVHKLHHKFKSFRIKTMLSETLDADQKAKFPLLDGKEAEVVVKKGVDKDNKVVVSVTAPGQGEIVYRTVCGKFVPLVTRYRPTPSEWLILAIRVDPGPTK